MYIITSDEYQPRFKAWLMHHDYVPGDKVNLLWFTVWVMKKWAEFENENEISKSISNEDHEKFTEWLFDTVPDGQLTLF